MKKFPLPQKDAWICRTNLLIQVSLGIGLAGVLLGLMVVPAKAWWFNSAQNTPAPHSPSSVSPTQHRGLVLSPLVSAWVPQFILQPLSQTTIQNPPNTAPASSAQNTQTPSTQPTLKPQATRIALSPATSTTPTQTLVLPSVRSEVTTSSTSMAQQILILVNKERSNRNLSSLTLNDQLTQSAQTYAALMQQLKFFDHTSPDGKTFKDRNEAAGYTNWSWMGENIAYGQKSAVQVMTEWMNSEGHKANILHLKAKELGVGFSAGATPYWVQEFGAQF